jgi:hypothetical protein
MICKLFFLAVLRLEVIRIVQQQQHRQFLLQAPQGSHRNNKVEYDVPVLTPQIQEQCLLGLHGLFVVEEWYLEISQDCK